jgi:hypothetical protein
MTNLRKNGPLRRRAGERQLFNFDVNITGAGERRRILLLEAVWHRVSGSAKLCTT